MGSGGPSVTEGHLGRIVASELARSVNGTKRIVRAAPETPLLFVLRNELKLTGPRLGCGMAQCGTCSVLLDGEEIRACVMPLSYALGKQVTTIEGLPAVWATQKGLGAAEAQDATSGTAGLDRRAGAAVRLLP